MLRETPCRTYLKYLVLHPEQYTDDQIRVKLEEKDLDFLGHSFTTRIREQCRLPEVFFPFNSSHAPSKHFLIRERVDHLFDKPLKRPTVEAFKILDRPKAKEFVEAMLILGAPMDAIAHTVTTKHGITVTEPGVQIYRKTFWDLDLLDHSDVRALIQLRSEYIADHTNSDTRKMAAAHKRASYKDSRRIAADMPSSPYTALIAQMQMGLMPKELNLVAVMSHLSTACAMKALATTYDNSPDGPLRTRTMIESLKIVQEIIAEQATPEAQVLKQLSKITIKTEQTDVPSVRQLSGGNHTVDVGVIEAPQTEK